MKLKTLLLAGALALATLPSLAAGLFPFPPAGGSQYPSTIPLTGVETIPADTNLTSGLNPATESITTQQLAGYVGSQNGTWRNGLIGGNFFTNLWQRGTTSASITTALLYGPDRWWGLSGTGTAFTIIKQTGASDITTGVNATARVQRTNGQTGVLPVCVGQVLTSGNSAQYQGKTVELSFTGLAGALFSAASSNITATIAYGTGSNESAANFSTGSWTGYTAQATTITLGTSFARYSAVASIPATATQIGVKMCYTPVGTAGATDFWEFGNAQLAVNAAAVAATTSTDTNYNILGFEYRDSGIEQVLQQHYYFEIDESAAITPIATCGNSTTSLALCYLSFPTTMRSIPVFTGDGGFTAGFAANTTTAMTGVSACTALAVSTAVASTAANTNGVLLGCTSAAAFGAAGSTSFLYSNNGSGKIKASAEL